MPFTHQGTGDAKDVTSAPWPSDQAPIAHALADSERLVQADQSLTPATRAAALANARDYLQDYAAGGWTENRLQARFDEVQAWAQQNGVPADRLLLGEFGVTAAQGGHGGALDADRFAWLDAVRRGAERLGAAWCYWEYSNPYGMSLTTADQSRRPDPVATAALRLKTEITDAQGN